MTSSIDLERCGKKWNQIGSFVLARLGGANSRAKGNFYITIQLFHELL